jgi:hypothetical protein
MDEPRFWSLIDAAKAQAGDHERARPPALRAALAALSPSAIQSFQRTYDQALLRANRWDLWGAAYLMMGGCSDDGFRYFRDWLISEGRAAYERALADPDSLADVPVQDDYELESFGQAALDAFAEHTDAALERDARVDGPPEGDEWDEDALAGMFPRLAARYPD